MESEQYLMKVEMLRCESVLEILEFQDDGRFEPLVKDPKWGERLNRTISVTKDVLKKVRTGDLIPKQQFINRLANSGMALSCDDWNEMMKIINSFSDKEE